MVIVIRDVKNYVIIINLLAGDPWLQAQYEVAASGVCQM